MRLLPILCALLCGTAWSQALVIQRVAVIDGTDRGARPEMTVVIDGNRIAAVTPWKQARVPRDAQVLDGTGKFLIPGLWDMHTHGTTDLRASWSRLLFIANGVVGVRDMSGPADAGAWRAAHASDRPRLNIYMGSPIVDGPNPPWPDSIVAATEAEGRETVDQQKQRGADFIKVYTWLPRGVYFAIADEAHKVGIPIEGHVPDALSAAEASDAGQKSIEHLTQVAEGCSREETAILNEQRGINAIFRGPNSTVEEKMAAGPRWAAIEARKIDTYDDAVAQALFARFVKNGTWQCPTLSLLRAQIDDPLSPEDPRLKYLSKDVRATWDAGYYKHLPRAARLSVVDSSRKQFAEFSKIVGSMYRAKVRILAGTDTMNPQCFPGFGLHDELALLVEAGLSPLAALQSATRDAAEFMGQLNRRGTIEAGKTADLVLLDKDPLMDIHNTRSIQAVILDGKLFPRASLDALLADAQELAVKRN
ncbi:amidohydrolase family protein [Nevskia soli]|uniref:amidohydrolase family protein n=1 Tax=Nevskia soli TaxID=418856 RepID=UPI0015D8DBEB|nr:amidohydrolase family protein [Nevskia soli]